MRDTLSFTCIPDKKIEMHIVEVKFYLKTFYRYFPTSLYVRSTHFTTSGYRRNATGRTIKNTFLTCSTIRIGLWRAFSNWYPTSPTMTTMTYGWACCRRLVITRVWTRSLTRKTCRFFTVPDWLWSTQCSTGAGSRTTTSIGRTMFESSGIPTTTGATLFKFRTTKARFWWIYYSYNAAFSYAV